MNTDHKTGEKWLKSRTESMLDFFILNDFTKVSWSQLDFLFFLVPPRLCSGGKRRRDDILRVSNDCGLSGLPPGKHSCAICCGSVLLP